MSKVDEMIEELKKISFKDSSNVDVVDLAPAIRIIEEYKQYLQPEEEE